MSYTIKNADGSILLTLPDGDVDIRSTSIALIGRNVDDYGTYLNTNMVNMLQNFASTSQPRSPLVGQIWYNTSDKRLRVYSPTGSFDEIKPVVLGQGLPVRLNAGDLYVDTTATQLYFSTNGVDYGLAGPIYSSINGKSGFVMERALATTGYYKDLLLLWHNGIIIGSVSTETVTLDALEAVRLQGLENIQAGFYLHAGNSLLNNFIKFQGTSTDSDFVFGALPGENYMVSTFDQITTGSIWIKNDTRRGVDPGNSRWTGTWPTGGADPGGLYLGANPAQPGGAPDLEIFASGTAPNRRSSIKSLVIGSRISMLTTTALGEEEPLTVKGSNVGVRTPDPTSALHVTGPTMLDGNLTVSGNVTVAGTYTFVDTNNLRISDKNIELATGTTLLNDIQLQGAGITLWSSQGNKFIEWGTYGTSGWNLSQDVNLVGDSSTYRIAGFNVLSSSTLGATVTQTSITRLGVLEEATITNVMIKGNGLTSRTYGFEVYSVTATSVSTGSNIFIGIVDIPEFLNTGSYFNLVAISETEYNGSYRVLSFNTTSTTSTFSATIVTTSSGLLSTITPTLGWGAAVNFPDTVISSQDGHVDLNNKQIHNLGYSQNVSDAASVQFVIDTVAVGSLKGLSLTVDISNMNNPNTQIATMLNQLVPAVNTITTSYPLDYLYDLPVGYRARVLCANHSINIPSLPLSLSKNIKQAQAYPSGVALNVLQDVAAIASSTSTTATITYTVKEFRVIDSPPKEWQFTRDIP